MIDAVFGDLERDDDGWRGTRTMDLGGNTAAVELWVQGEDDEMTARQREALQRFQAAWPAFQTDLINALIRYYNEKERFSYGPDDAAEAAAWWPEIDTKEALLRAVTLETIVVPEDFMMDQGRCIYLLFSKAWGGEDLDDRGIGVRCINEAIDEIAYKDLAF